MAALMEENARLRAELEQMKLLLTGKPVPDKSHSALCFSYQGPFIL